MKYALGYLVGLVASMNALQAHAFALGVNRIFNDISIADLQGRLVEISDKLATIQKIADDAHRDVSEDEQKEMDALFVEFERIKNDIARRERIAATAAAVSAPQGRSTEPAPPAMANNSGGARPSATPAPAGRDGLRNTAVRTPEERGRWGFHSFGEFALVCQRAARPGGQIDNRLAVMNAAPANPAAEGEDGGYLVPPEFRQEIMSKVMAEDELLPRTDQIPTSGNSITFPKDETTPWQSSGGIQAYWEGEARSYTGSRPVFEQMTVRANKLTALVPVTDELLEDAPALTAYLNRKAPEVMGFKINDAIINGNGAGMPLGIMNAPCTVEVAKETSQPANTVLAQNILKMYSRMYAKWRGNAVWLIHQDVEPLLPLLNIPVKNVAGSENVGGAPVYVPPGGLSGAQYATILGRPIIPMQACPALSSAGDMIFADLKQYCTAIKSTGIRADTSIHLYFDYGATAFRFTFRVGGQPWWSAAISPKNGSNTLAPFVRLGAR